MGCHYCINNYGSAPKYKSMKTDTWIQSLNRIRPNDGMPITLGGGEPTMHTGFYDIVNNVRRDTNLDLLTNGTFDIREFMKKISPDRFKRGAKYASIRFSYHSGYSDTNMLLAKVCRMQQEGYSVGIWAVVHPEVKRDIKKVQRMAEDIGIDFRVKEFLGMYKGKLYGTYKYKFALDCKLKDVMCKPSELLIAPNGDIHRCHYWLYENKGCIGNICDSEVELLDKHVRCCDCGNCNPCDIKTKFNRFQEEGHCSVDIIK